MLFLTILCKSSIDTRLYNLEQKLNVLLFADDVILLASSGRDLQPSLEQLAAKCEEVRMRINTSTSETSQKEGGLPPSCWVRGSASSGGV